MKTVLCGQFVVKFSDSLIIIEDVTRNTPLSALQRCVLNNASAHYLLSRSTESVIGEFLVHRWCYRLGIARKRTRTVDAEAKPVHWLLAIYDHVGAMWSSAVGRERM
jgi:hypothetical protein